MKCPICKSKRLVKHLLLKGTILCQRCGFVNKRTEKGWQEIGRIPKDQLEMIDVKQ